MRISARYYLMAIVAIVMCISIIALTGWVNNRYVLGDIAEVPTMKVNTAICFFVLGIGAILQMAHVSWRYLQPLWFFVFGLSGLTLLEYPLDSDFLIDQLFIDDLISGSMPGRMSPATATNFMLLSSLFFGLSVWNGKHARFLDILFVIFLLLNLIAVIIYVLAPEELYSIGFFSTLSPPTIFCFIAFAIVIGFLIQSPESVFSLITLATNGARRFRFLMIYSVLIPQALGFYVLILSRESYVGALFSVAIYIVITFVSIAAGLIYSARREDLFFRDLAFERDQSLSLQQKLSLVMDESREAHMLFSVDGRVIFANRGASKLLGWSYGELMHMHIEHMIPQRLRESHRHHVREFVNSEDQSLNIDDPMSMVALTKEGEEVPILTTVTKRAVGDEVLIAFSAKDASRVHDRLSELDEEMKLDALTGVFNRRAYENEVAEMDKGKRASDRCIVLMIDLDHFKSINDTWGHAAGDLVLRVAARTIVHCLRKCERIYRYGGEEFVVFLSNMSEKSVSHLAERLRRQIERMTVVYNSQEIRITCSIGITSSTEKDISIMDVVKRADQLLYEAKTTGRNRVLKG